MYISLTIVPLPNFYLIEKFTQISKRICVTVLVVAKDGDKHVIAQTTQ